MRRRLGEEESSTRSRVGEVLTSKGPCCHLIVWTSLHQLPSRDSCQLPRQRLEPVDPAFVPSFPWSFSQHSRSKLASESLNRPNSAMNRGKGPKVAEPRRHRDSLAPLELPPDDAGVPPQVRPRPETVSTLPLKGTTSDLKMRQLRRNQTGRHLSELRHGVGILAALNAAGTESHGLPSSPPPAPHPHLHPQPHISRLISSTTATLKWPVHSHKLSNRETLLSWICVYWQRSAVVLPSKKDTS